MPPFDSSKSLYGDFLELDPLGRKASFFGRVPQGLGQGQQRTLEDMFDPTFNKYLGALGGQIQGGQTPTLTFNDFLNQFNLGRMIKREQPQQNRFLSSSTDFRY